ncbi:PDZ domain-containing protein [Kaarinaea lacus]
MKKQLPIWILIAAAGVIIGLLLQRPESAPQATQPVADNNSKSSETAQTENTNQHDTYELVALRELVQQEIQARKELETQLGDLFDRVETLTNSADTANTETATSTTISTQNRRQGVTRPGWINKQALLDAGLDESEANRIREIYENVEMEKLYLRDRAIREGYIGDQRYRSERDQLNARLDALREELSEPAYDAYLFATGRPNRVVVQSSLRTSPAREAGVKTGDNIIRYDNMRIWTWADLRDATTKCQTNSVVEVTLERKGQEHRVFVPCGPLGVRLDNMSKQP